MKKNKLFPILRTLSLFFAFITLFGAGAYAEYIKGINLILIFLQIFIFVALALIYGSWLDYIGNKILTLIISIPAFIKLYLDAIADLKMVIFPDYPAFGLRIIMALCLTIMLVEIFTKKETRKSIIKMFC